MPRGGTTDVLPAGDAAGIAASGALAPGRPTEVRRGILEVLAGPIVIALTSFGQMITLLGDSFKSLFTRRFPVQEFTEQIRFLARVSVVPVILVTLPFTVVVQFFIGQLLNEIGAIDLAGAGAGFALVRELGPFCAVLVVAGAGATAICADLGARTIREEIDAMRVLGINPAHRLVLPRLLACIVVSICLFAFVACFGLIFSYAFSVGVQGASPGVFMSDLTLLTNTNDFLLAIVKSALFGLGAGLVACHLGLTVKGGPKGVGNAVNQTVVFSLMLLAVINTVCTQVYAELTGR